MRAFADFLVRLRKEKPLAVGLSVILLLLILVALFADVLAPFAPNEVFLMDRLQGSSARYPLGTDQLGRDFASRRAAAGGVAGAVPDGGGVLPEHGRRRGARPARPAPARRQRPARRLRRAGGQQSHVACTARAEVTHVVGPGSCDAQLVISVGYPRDRVSGTNRSAGATACGITRWSTLNRMKVSRVLRELSKP